MFRVWGKIFQNNHMLKDMTVCNDTADTRTHKVFHAIDEICEYVGVRDRFHFSRMFKSRYGLSPGRYRASRARVT